MDQTGKHMDGWLEKPAKFIRLVLRIIHYMINSTNTSVIFPGFRRTNTPQAEEL